MLPKPKHCSQCGAAVEPQSGDETLVETCPSCHARLVQNPRPITASILLNDRREVLLAKCKREPAEAVWCLPMGFVEAGESLARAALRTLEEKTGVRADVIRLLDIDSSRNEEHGDLLVVTFEVRKTGGTEGPGEDVESIAYFPLSRYPALALRSNEKALRLCAEMHLEDWAIRDSFEHLQGEEDRVMLSDALIALIRDHAADVARAWLAEVRESPTTSSYRKLDSADLLERVTTALSQFGGWLAGHEAEQEVTDYYVAVGRERRAQGFSNHEVISALMLLKKHLWAFAREHGVWERPIDIYRTLELSRRIAVFFDRAIYHTTCGFEMSDPG